MIPLSKTGLPSNNDKHVIDLQRHMEYSVYVLIFNMLNSFTKQCSYFSTRYLYCMMLLN